MIKNGDINLKLFIGLSRTMLYIERELDKIFRKHGLTKGQFGVLEALYHKGELTASEIHSLILTTAGNLPVVIKNLEKQGLIEREIDTCDRRRQILSITEKGKEITSTTFEENKKRIDEIFSVWSDKDKEKLYSIIGKFREAYYDEA